MAVERPQVQSQRRWEIRSGVGAPGSDLHEAWCNTRRNSQGCMLRVPSRPVAPSFVPNLSPGRLLRTNLENCARGSELDEIICHAHSCEEAELGGGHWGVSAGSSRDVHCGGRPPEIRSARIWPKKRRSELGFERYSVCLAPVLAAEPIFDFPTRFAGSRRNVENRTCGQHPSQKQECRPTPSTCSSAFRSARTSGRLWTIPIIHIIATVIKCPTVES